MSSWIRRGASFALASAVIMSTSVAASADIRLSYEFDIAGEVASNFDSYVKQGSVSHTLTGGLSDSGAITSPDGTTAKAVYTTKARYSIGPVGSTYTFVSYMHNTGGDGYGGMGFTAAPAADATTDGYPYVPTDGLGVSVHGGGFVFNDGLTTVEQLWNGTSSVPEITTIVPYVTGSTNLLDNGSPSHWYKVILVIERMPSNKMDCHLEVWPTDAAGTPLNGTASAIYEFNNRDATGLLTAPAIMSYFSFSGDRIHSFDNFSINLEGGVSIIEENAPVVLTSDASESAGAIAADGSVTDVGGSAVVERGFAYSASADPTISDNLIVVSGTTGDYSGTSDVLSNGTYHVRAYATNSMGTSYGADVEVVIANGASGGGTDPGTDHENTSSDSSSLAQTGFDPVVPAGIGFGMAIAGYLATRRRVRP